MIENLTRFLFSLMIISLPVLLSGQIYSRMDTLKIPISANIPIIDGNMNDPAWENAQWNPINYLWMPYDNNPAYLGDHKLWDGQNDFSGRFKTVWSPTENLLYVLAEITDDVFVDGYVAPQNGYPNYDILEVFIDEDRSGGEHVYDGIPHKGTTPCPDCNAENAFAYHMAVPKPADGEVSKNLSAMDIQGNKTSPKPDYKSHFPEFSMKKTGNKYVYEFSLTVYNDTYVHSNPSASVSQLYTGKVMGLSVAYCDNDDPGESPLKRDHFFGSVYIPQLNQNDHWINADWFGVAKLTEGTGTGMKTSQNKSELFTMSIHEETLQLDLNSLNHDKINVRILNAIGSEMIIKNFMNYGETLHATIDLTYLSRGFYIIDVMQGNSRKNMRFIY